MWAVASGNTDGMAFPFTGRSKQDWEHGSKVWGGTEGQRLRSSLLGEGQRGGQLNKTSKNVFA